MKKVNLTKEGTLPKSREIYFYVFMGNIYYWLKKAQFRLLHPEKSIEIKKSKIKLTMDIINENTGGDVTGNYELMKHIPDNNLNNEIVNSASNGTPLITLGDGSNPKVMITAGLHGNELAPQIAALRLINELYDKKINGTVYIIPFVAPECTSKNSGLFRGENLNLIADQEGNPTSELFKLIQSLNIISLADYHSTSTDPARNAVIYYPKIGSSKIAVYITKSTNSALLALIKHPGFLIAKCNSNNIPAVICEVKSPDGVASDFSIDFSYNQMKSFLKYHQIV